MEGRQIRVSTHAIVIGAMKDYISVETGASLLIAALLLLSITRIMGSNVLRHRYRIPRFIASLAFFA